MINLFVCFSSLNSIAKKKKKNRSRVYKNKICYITCPVCLLEKASYKRYCDIWDITECDDSTTTNSSRFFYFFFFQSTELLHWGVRIDERDSRVRNKRRFPLFTALLLLFSDLWRFPYTHEWFSHSGAREKTTTVLSRNRVSSFFRLNAAQRLSLKFTGVMPVRLFFSKRLMAADTRRNFNLGDLRENYFSTSWSGA